MSHKLAEDIAQKALRIYWWETESGAQRVAVYAATRIEELEAKLGMIQDEWTNAVYGDLEKGVDSLNVAAATDFYKRYPLVASFGVTLNRIIDGEQDDD